MDIMLLIGNLISFVAACFMAASSIAKKKEKIFLLQMLECVILAVANLFFHSYAGIFVLLLCGFRNWLIAKKRYTGVPCVCICVICAVVGILINNRGWIGMIVVAATFIYSVAVYFAQRELTIKIHIAINVTLWIIYEIFIFDISSLVSDSIVLVITIIAIIGILRKKCNDI